MGDMDEVRIPDGLVAEVEAGRCVAFVGAGFAAPAVPAWTPLLREVATTADLDPGQRRWIAELLERSSARDLEAVAQILQDNMADFGAAVARAVQASGDADRIAERLRWLRGIPFDAIVTTNVDPHLVGAPPGRDAYRAALRRPANRWWDRRFWDGDAGPGGAPVIKLHGHAGGDAPDLVFTQRDYRRRIHGSPGYLGFLRSLFATRTVLFMGVSFTDAYLNELRSEVLAMFDHRRGDPPLAYAILNDVGEAQAHHLAVHEGIAVLAFDSHDGQDFRGFDDLLHALHRRTNPQAVLGQALAGRTILWVDAEPGNNQYGMRYLATAAHEAGGGGTVEQKMTSQQALTWLATPGNSADLVITRWGHGSGHAGGAAGADLLRGMRRGNLLAPVLVFAGADHLEANRREAMALGATDHVAGWDDLFREIVRVLGPAR